MKRHLGTVLLALCLATSPVYAADIAGAKDPEAVGQRFVDASIVYYDQQPFESYEIPTGKATGKKQLESSRTVEGRVTDVRYEIPAERAVLEVFRNYEDALKTKGFEILFSCESESCGGREFNHIAGLYYRGFAETPKGQRFMAAKLPKPEGDVYATVFVVKNYGVGGPTKNKVYARVVTVETKPMDTQLVTVNASDMQQAIDALGHIALYGIQFEFDSDKLLPASQESIAEIAKLLKQNSKLNLHVVGHTDGKGAFDYNMSLSKRRAEAVVKELTHSHGISDNRLLANGVANLAPVTSNTTEDGRAKNRRVELVQR